MDSVAYHSVYNFNDVAGQFDNVNDNSIARQLSYITEELGETLVAFEDNNKIELLDGACDLYVTVMGLLQKLRKQGYNVVGALQSVNDNNMSKYSTEPSESLPDGFTETYNAEYRMYVIKDSRGKISKPEGFQAVDLSDFVPQEQGSQ